MTDRKAIAERIRALLAKTVENGATEAEAFAAMEKARELMEKYQIDMTEAEVEAEGAHLEFRLHTYLGNLRLDERLATAIGAYCECVAWAGHDPDQGKGVKFFGLYSDAVFAGYLCDALCAFIKRQVFLHLVQHPEWSHKARRERTKAFAAGCWTRINQRLFELAAQRNAAAARIGGTRNALVTIKGALVKREFAKLGFKLQKSMAKTTYRGANAFAAGQSAGDHATFNRGVNGTGRTAAIGAR